MAERESDLVTSMYESDTGAHMVERSLQPGSETEIREIQQVSEEVFPEIDQMITRFNELAGRVQEFGEKDPVAGMPMLDEIQAHAIEARNQMNEIAEEIARAKRSLKGIPESGANVEAA